MNAWQRVFRNGIAPSLSTDQLDRLRMALLARDSRLIQGSTTSPPPFQCTRDWPIEAACAIGFGFIEPGSTVGAVEEQFARLCRECDERIGEDGACRYFLNWFDDTPMDRCFVELAAEIDHILLMRRSQAA